MLFIACSLCSFSFFRVGEGFHLSEVSTISRRQPFSSKVLCRETLDSRTLCSNSGSKLDVERVRKIYARTGLENSLLNLGSKELYVRTFGFGENVRSNSGFGERYVPWSFQFQTERSRFGMFPNPECELWRGVERRRRNISSELRIELWI